MSLNKFTETQKGQDLKLKIGCDVLDCDVMNCGQVNMPNGSDINAHDVNIANELKVEVGGFTDIAGNNYATPDLGQPNYSLHTDGAGTCFWSPDDTGSGDITYNGTPPTQVGQLVKFSSTDGKTANQSLIKDDGASLDLNNQNITNVNLVKGYDLDTFNTNINNNTTAITGKLNKSGDTMSGNLNMGGNDIVSVNLVDGVDLGNFKADYDSKINQDLRTSASPEFVNLNLKANDGHITLKDAGGVKKYEIEYENGGGQLLINNGTENAQIRISDNSFVEIPQNLLLGTELKTDTINERTVNAGVSVDGVLIKDGNVDGFSISGLNNTKADKDGTADLRITKATSKITLKDNVSVGGSMGLLQYDDSVDTNLTNISAPSGYISVSKNGSSNNTLTTNLELKNDCVGTPSTGVGGTLVFRQEVQPSTFKNACSIGSLMYNVGAGTEGSHIVFNTMDNGSALIERMRCSSTTLTHFGDSINCNGGNFRDIERYNGTGVMNIAQFSNTNQLNLCNSGTNTRIKGTATLDEATQIKGVLTLGTSPNEYKFKNTTAGVNNGDILVYNSGTKELEFKSKNPPNISVQQTGGQTLTSSTSVFTPINFASELFKTGITHSNITNNSRITINTAGKYMVCYDIPWDAVANGYRLAFIAVNGLTGASDTRYGRTQINADASDPQSHSGSALINLAVNDYVELYAQQNSGVNVDVGNVNLSFRAELMCYRVAD